MKKILVLCTCVLMLGLMTGPVSAQISYCKDVLEPGNPGGLGTCDIIGDPCRSDDDCAGGALTCIDPSLKTWDETWTMGAGETIEMDIWLNDVPEDLLTAGFYVTYDTALIDIVSVVPNDTNNDGQWDGSSTSNFEVAPGEWFLALADFSCVLPDADGDILMGSVTFQCQAPGDVDVTVQTIPEFTTVVGCVANEYDDQISPNIVTVTQTGGAPCTGPGDCVDDGNSCTVADCVDDICVHNPKDCDDDNPCTTDSCNPDTGECVNSPVTCDDSDECTTDSCDPLTGVCSNIPITCDDGDLCTIDGCDPASGCVFVPDDCDDSSLCTDDSCDPASGCLNIPNIDCSDAKPCTEDICNPSTGECEYPAVDCDDGVECTVDSCDNDLGGCQNVPDDGVCSDDIDCTDDLCDLVDGCQNEDNCPFGEFCNVDDNECQEPTCSISVTPSSPTVEVLGTVNFNVVVDGTCAVDPSYTWEISDSGCTGEATGSGIGSTVDETGRYTAGDERGTDIVRVTDFANGDLCATAEVTVVTTTTTVPSGCTTNDDCDDGVFCNGAENCVEEICVDGTPPCPAELCDEDTDTCIDCLIDDDCDDGVDCTDDACVEETCENTPNDDNCPDDGLYCNGEEFCDEAEGCSSTGNPCSAGETCDEETDSCSGACLVDVVPESLRKSHWIPLGPVIIRINTVDVNPTFSSRINISCESDGMGIFPKAIIPLGKVILPSFGADTTVVIGYALILPASWTGSLQMESETCTVSVGDCQSTDTFELQYLSIGGIPLSE